VDIAYSSLKPSIRFVRDECIDLPECTYIDHKVTLSTEQQKAYDSLKAECIAELEGGLVTAANEGVMLMKLLQIACGAIYNDEGDTASLPCEPKLKELGDIIEEVGTKIIIFVPFKHSIQVISKWLDTKQKSLSYGVVNGSVSKGERDRVFKEFQTGGTDIIIAHPAAMAHGLTLTASNTIVWWGPLDNFEVYEQANGRITRPGQTRLQYIKHLISSPIEQAVYQRLKKKESMQGILLDMLSN
jgi:SNF2 family DNA or RNA helicase